MTTGQQGAQHSSESRAQRWCVVKATRSYDGGVGYDGPSMEKAGLTGPAGPYDTYDEAIETKMALQEVNAVGWRIVAYLGRSGGSDGR